MSTAGFPALADTASTGDSSSGFGEACDSNTLCARAGMGSMAPSYKKGTPRHFVAVFREERRESRLSAGSGHGKRG